MMKKTLFFKVLLTGTLWAALCAPPLLAAAFQDASVTMYQDAFKLMINGSYQEAIARFEAVIAAFPDSSKADDARYHIGFCLEKTGNPAEAFNQYLNLIESSDNGDTSRKALQRAAQLARQLRTTAGDPYDRFLHERFDSRTAANRRFLAIKMASMGNWEGISYLVEGLEEGSQVEKIRISELLAHAAYRADVRKALTEALERGENTVVSINALVGLHPYLRDEAIRSVVIEKLINDEASEMVRISSARSLAQYLSEKDVQQAFENILTREQNPRILQNIAFGLLNIPGSQPFREIAMERLESEKNPQLIFALNSALGRKTDTSRLEWIVKTEQTNDPEPRVRVHALHSLKDKTNDPDIELIFINKLENDPNENVRVVALSALSSRVDDPEVKKAVLRVMRTSENLLLVATTVRTLRNVVSDPEIRNEMAGILQRSNTPFIVSETVRALAPYADNPEILDTLVSKLEKVNPLEVRLATASALRQAPVHISSMTDRIEQIIIEEEDRNMAYNLLTVLDKVNPERAEKVRLKKNLPRQMDTYSFEFSTEVVISKDGKVLTKNVKRVEEDVVKQESAKKNDEDK